MNKTEKTELLDILSGLAEYFNFELTKYVITAYLEDLDKYNITDIKKAASVIRKKSKYMPKIADFEELLNPALSLDDRAEIAWSLVLKAIDKFGIYYSFTFQDKAIRKALDIIGYSVICETLESELNWKKADFIKVYKTFKKQDSLSFDAPDYIAGLIENSNNQEALSDLKECSAFYVGKSVSIVETDNKIAINDISGYLAGGQNGRKELD
jgi:hypothetical protein